MHNKYVWYKWLKQALVSHIPIQVVPEVIRPLSDYKEPKINTEEVSQGRKVHNDHKTIMYVSRGRMRKWDPEWMRKEYSEGRGQQMQIPQKDPT